ncbi:MAG TPA: hypothetical protein VFW34_08420 [Candidatus Rubrimentiphilum sp.]|nr:hypothetical protein [Candidatus Rubrimentiphilum sp.]
MATKKHVEDTIFTLEGFRVEFDLFDPRQPLPEYEWRVMAPQRWKISDWKNERLGAYRTLAKGLSVFRGDGSPVPRDMQLGNLRDSYFEAQYGQIARPGTGASNVIRMDEREGGVTGRGRKPRRT